MKRFITYVYVYDKGEKQKNIGFIKVDEMNETAKLDVRVQNVGKYSGKCEVMLLTGTDKLTAVPIGELEINRGVGNAQYLLEKNNIKNSKYALEDILAVRIDISKEVMLGSCWKDEAAEVITGNYSKYCEDSRGEKSGGNKSDYNKTEKNKLNENKLNENKSNDNKPNDNKSNVEDTKLDKVGKLRNNLRKISLSDIKNFPKRNWYLCNNSFLLHGFFNYHYLVVKEVIEDDKKKYYLGVPGIYERPEKAMALLFGFPEFEAKNSNQPEPIGEFGYWYCLLDM